MDEKFNILELFSGIGGMHYALKKSGINGEIIAAIDINPIANTVYKNNYPETTIFNKNIQSITTKFIEKLNVNTILMSPPCQPFTRVGKQKDINDNRTDALKQICQILPELKTIKYILMENVKGFENSEARNLYTQTLQKSNFYYREFILSPSQFGIPNTRYRYFCVARQCKDFSFESKLWEFLPLKECKTIEKFPLEDFLEKHEDIPNHLYLEDSILLKRIMLLDIVDKNSHNTICFTKAYTRYCEGTGSVFTALQKSDVENILAKVSSLDPTSQEYLNLIRKTKLRYFTPREVLRLMCFPDAFKFPKEITDKQKYRLIGNSVNILVVSELIKLFIEL